jgi:hypothetical protein
MGDAITIENNRERERMIALIGRLSNDDLCRDAGGGWTVSVIFAHLAFWDQWTRFRIRKWKQEGFVASPIDFDVINDSLLPLFKTIPPREAANLAITAAEAIDHEIEQLPVSLIDAIDAMGDKRRIRRSMHRNMHLDQIEAILSKSILGGSA